MDLVEALVSYVQPLLNGQRFRLRRDIVELYETWRQMPEDEKERVSEIVLRQSVTREQEEDLMGFIVETTYHKHYIDDFPCWAAILDEQIGQQERPQYVNSEFTLLFLDGKLQILRNPWTSQLPCQTCRSATHCSRNCDRYPFHELRRWKLEMTGHCSKCTEAIRNTTSHRCRLAKGCSQCGEEHVSSINHNHHDWW